MVAISVDEPKDTRALVERQNQRGAPLALALACDPTRKATKAFGVYDYDHDIALPATLILDKKGEIAWKYIGDSVFDRPEEDALVAALKRLSAAAPPTGG